MPLAAVAMGATWYFITRPLINTLSAYLYVNKDLKTRISWAEAREVCWLFVWNWQGRWYPLKQLLELPEEQRRPALFALAEQITRQHGRP